MRAAPECARPFRFFSGSDRDVLKMIEEQSEGLKSALQGRGLKLEDLRFEAKA